MKKFLSFALALVLTVSLLPALAHAATITPTKSTNCNYQNYLSNQTLRGKSYLFENPTGGLTRVESVGNYWEPKLVVEDYDSQFRCQAVHRIPSEIPWWGGFFAGENYNFFMFTDNNSEESDDKEVLRVVKYSKDWQRLDSFSLYGANTAGFTCAMRCAEYGGYLYIHTAHIQYRTSDGLCHQTNVLLSIRESDMTMADGYYRPGFSNSSYVSHSFNQFILVD